MTERQSDKELRGYLEGFATMMDRSFAKAKQHGYYYKSLYHFAVEEMKYYQPAHLTTQERSIVMKAIKNLGFVPQVKQCFYNSQILAISDNTNTIKYVEGYGKNIIPTLHGWCEINGKVIDLTWKKENKEYVLGDFDEHRAYAGVVFPTKYVSRYLYKNGFSNTLIEDYANDFPVMKQKWNNGTAIINTK